MATFQQACDAARTESLGGYVMHVVARIVVPNNPALPGMLPHIAQDGYRVTEWFGDAVVASYRNGVKLD